jgi:hypothetical protein
MRRARKLVFEVPRYLPKLAVLAATAPPSAGQVCHVTVLHDEWCDRLKNRTSLPSPVVTG